MAPAVVVPSLLLGQGQQGPFLHDGSSSRVFGLKCSLWLCCAGIHVTERATVLVLNLLECEGFVQAVRLLKDAWHAEKGWLSPCCAVWQKSPWKCCVGAVLLSSFPSGFQHQMSQLLLL